MRHILFDLSFERWEVALLALIPALINVCIFIYVRFYLPNYSITRIFSVFILCLILWQLNNIFSRISNTIETADTWNLILSIGWLFLPSVGLLFTLHYTGNKKYLYSLRAQALLFGPFFIFYLLGFLHISKPIYHYSAFWGWVVYAPETSVWAIMGYCMAVVCFISLGFLVRFAYKQKQGSNKRNQAITIATAFSIPVLQGITTELVIPVFTNHDSIPLTSIFMTVFSAGTVLALVRYKLFSPAESIKLRSILGAMTDILMVLSTDGKLRFVNAEGALVLGIKEVAETGFGLQNIFSNKEGSEKFFKEIFIPALSGKKTMNYTTELKTRDHKKIAVMISATPIHASASETYVLLLIRDITDYLKTEYQLKESERHLHEKTQELNTFFYRTTHDLKGPLASIMGLTSLAKMDSENPEMIDYLDKIEKCASRLDGIVYDFIKIIHLTERRLEVSNINIKMEVNENLQVIKNHPAADGIKITFDCDLITKFHSDKSWIKTLLYNLLMNAIQYKKPLPFGDSFVHIEIRNLANGITMLVRDNGVGIDKKTQKDIYNIFFRGTELSKGSGLGLFIVKNAVAKLSGEIQLQSEPGVGSTFLVYLPNLPLEIPVLTN